MQLFARLGAKQSLGSLNLPLFSALPSSPRGGLCPGDVVEIMGGEGSGKSEMLLNITAQCILPRWWRGKEIGGKEVEVVWVSTDYKFDVVRLAAILEGSLCENGTTAELEKGNGVRRSSKPVTSQLRTATDVPVNANRGLLQSDDKEGDDYQKFISTCLSRVHVVYCNSSTELALALQSLRLNFLRQKPDVCSLVLDNVAEFYWADRAEAGSVHGAEMKQSVWVNALHSLMKEHHLVVFSAKPFLFVKMDPSHSNHQATKTKTGYKVSTQLCVFKKMLLIFHSLV